MPQISIILPVYNSKKERLSQSIESVLSQSFKDFELIIINDASTNDIEETILKYQQKDKRILYIKNEHNLKLTQTLNKGLEIAQWKYIARIDDEDFWKDTDKLSKQIEFMETNSDYGICGTNCKAITPDWKDLFDVKKPQTNEDIMKNIFVWPPFVHVSIVMRRECIENVGLYDTNRDYIEDHELWLRIGQKYKMYNLQDYTTFFRVNNQGISIRNRRRQRLNILKTSYIYRKCYPNFIKNYILNIAHYILTFIPSSVVLWLMKLKN